MTLRLSKKQGDALLALLVRMDIPASGTYHAKPVPPKRAVTVEFDDQYIREVRQRVALAMTCPVTRALLKAIDTKRL